MATQTVGQEIRDSHKLTMDTAWGAGYDCAAAGGLVVDCPVDANKEPELYVEWMAGWEDARR